MAEKNLLRMCCTCKKIKIGEVWEGDNYPNYQEQINKHNLTHGYCPSCLKETYKKYNLIKNK